MYLLETSLFIIDRDKQRGTTKKKRTKASVKETVPSVKTLITLQRALYITEQLSPENKVHSSERSELSARHFLNPRNADVKTGRVNSGTRL